jgi:hypothetical protein
MAKAHITTDKIMNSTNIIDMKETIALIKTMFLSTTCSKGTS